MQSSINLSNFVGRHLLLDVQLKSVRGINDVTEIYNILENLSVLLDMTLVYPPIVARFPWASNELEKFTKSLGKENVTTQTIAKMQGLLENRQKKECGISGICVWLESHAAIHTWTEDLFFSFDAYSCKEFDVPKAVDFLLLHFDVKNYNGLNIVRTINEAPNVKILKG